LSKETKATEALRQLRSLAPTLRALLMLEEQLGDVSNLERTIADHKAEIQKLSAEEARLALLVEQHKMIVEETAAAEKKLAGVRTELSSLLLHVADVTGA
jgi:vacuolar-type H+-ATPase subunit I/STV1